VARFPFFMTCVVESTFRVLLLPASVRVLFVRSKVCTRPCRWLALEPVPDAVEPLLPLEPLLPIEPLLPLEPLLPIEPLLPVPLP
jgi:hypothetical protein